MSQHDTLTLEPCPFCGAQPEQCDVGDHVVTCPSCGVDGPYGAPSGVAGAIQGWNRRAALSATQPAKAAQSDWSTQRFNAPVYPPDGTESPFTVINLGSGKVQMGDSIHDGRLPALWFGINGQGMGHEETMNREAHPGETLAVVTFANVEGLDVLLDVIQRIRREKFPEAQAAQSEPAEHWHRLYLEKCQQYNDRVAQLGGVIEGLEAEAAQGEPVRELKSALNGMLTFFGMDDDADSKPVFDKARKALGIECAPYTTIDMGHGKWEVGAGTNAGLPCIAFGRNGSGKVGEPMRMDAFQMSADETYAVITFANVTGLDVLQEKVNEVRECFFAGSVPAFQLQPAVAQGAGEVVAAGEVLQEHVYRAASLRNQVIWYNGLPPYGSKLYTQPAAGADVKLLTRIRKALVEFDEGRGLHGMNWHKPLIAAIDAVPSTNPQRQDGVTVQKGKK